MPGCVKINQGVSQDLPRPRAKPGLIMMMNLKRLTQDYEGYPMCVEVN